MQVDQRIYLQLYSTERNLIVSPLFCIEFAIESDVNI